jgi:hypothetical protein
MSIKQDAIQLLSAHRYTPDMLLTKLRQEPDTSMIFYDEKGDQWHFVIRHRCRHYLMVKTGHMKQYEEVSMALY